MFLFRIESFIVEACSLDGRASALQVRGSIPLICNFFNPKTNLNYFIQDMKPI